MSCRGPAVNDGSWHQLVGVYNNGATSIYVDGNLAGTGWAGYSNNGAQLRQDEWSHVWAFFMEEDSRAP